MLLEFEVRTFSRCCAKTDKALGPGDVYFSVLEVQEEETVRRDYCVEAWQGAPERCLGWWRSRVPVKQNEKPQLAPAEVMLNLFGALDDQPADQQFRYLLGLLLVRRRVLKRKDSTREESGQEVLTLYAPRRDEHFELIVDEPNKQQAEQLQQRMIDLLYGDAVISTDSPEPNQN